MAELPPGVKEVGRLPAEGGGYWVLGSDGGVFAIGGAQFLGGYTSLESMGFGKQDATRSFDGGVASITASGNSGYILTDINGMKYQFDPKQPEKPMVPTPITEGVTQAPVTPQVTPSTLTGEAILSSALKEYGLESLGGELLSYLRGEGQGSVDATYIKMRESPQYKQRFSGMAGREAAGYDPISEEEYVRWEGQTRSLFDHYGIPKEFYDTPEERAAFIAGDVSVAELKDRIENGYQAVFSSPPETLTALQSMYGVDTGGLAAFFLDPTKGEEIIKKQWTSAQIGTQALKTGFGGLTAAEGERLATSGVTGQEAQGAFGMLGQATQLTGDFSRDEKLGIVEGDEAAKAKLGTEATKKKGVFEGGGTFAGGQGGLSGLGTSNE